MSDSYKIYASQDYVDEKVNGKVTSWNDLPDRPFGEMPIETVFVDNVTVEVTDGWAEDDAFQLSGVVDGETYTVTVDGVEYKCVAHIVTAEGWDDSIVLGNQDLADYEEEGVDWPDTGEPFAVLWSPDGSNYTSFVHKTDGTHTVSVSGVALTPVPLDPKFLPDTLNTVEFRSTSKNYNFYENADENKSIDAQKLVDAIQNGSRAVVIYSGSDAYIKTEYFKTMDEQTNNNDAYLYVGWKVVDDASPEVVMMKLYYDTSVNKYVVVNV